MASRYETQLAPGHDGSLHAAGHPKGLNRMRTAIRAVRIGQTVLPFMAAGAIALDNNVHFVHPTPSAAKSENPNQIARGAEAHVRKEKDTILPGTVDIYPGVNFRTSPYIDKGIINGRVFRDKPIRVWNPTVVSGTKAEPLTRNSAGIKDSYQDIWIKFPFEGQDTYVNIGPATKDFVDVDTKEPTDVTRITTLGENPVSYYEGPNGQNYTGSRVEPIPAVE